MCLAPRADARNGKEHSSHCCFLPTLCSQLQEGLLFFVGRQSLVLPVWAQYFPVRGTLPQTFQIRAMGPSPGICHLT